MINPDKEKIKKENTTRVILNIPNEIDNKFKELSAKRGMAKSQMIIFAMSWYLDYSKSMDLMPKLIETLKNVDDLSNKDSKPL